MSKLSQPSARNRMPTYGITRVAPPDFVRPATRAKGPGDDDVDIARVSEAERVTRVTGDSVAGGTITTATETLFRTRDGRIVGKDDPDKLTKVALPGQEIVLEDAQTVPYAPLRPRHGTARR